MSTYMRARLASDKVDADGNFTALAGFRIALVGPAPLIGSGELKSDVTKPDGRFEFINYRKGPSHRPLELVVKDIAGRVLPFSRTHHVSLEFELDQSGRIRFKDVDYEQIVQGDFIIREADARGLAVTLGTGDAKRLSHGNAVTVLVDNAAFTHAAALIRGAEESILLSQLTFDLPLVFKADATRETTKVVFEFRPPAPDADHPRTVYVGDHRPERLLLEAADKGVDIRILLHALKLPLLLKIIAGALLFPFAGTDGIFAVGGLLEDHTSIDECRRYFGEAGRPNIKVQDFQQPLWPAGVMHARLAIIDCLHATCMGASFVQSYVDTHDHAIDAPVRGSSDGLPNHDAGIGMTGPAVADLHEAMKLLWDTAAPNEPIPPLPRVPPAQTAGGDGICSIQIVRTLSEDRFRDPSGGEKGILEAYLRAIANAEDFIYLENQYFTNNLIGDALVGAMKHRPDLQVIVVLNIRPDQPFYPFKQRRLITCIRRAIGETPDNPKQFGVFTRWTHETGEPRPRMLPIYVHAKVGIVDDAWATVGSANLDGLSLDFARFGDAWNILPFGEQRAIEVNALLFKEIDGPPQSDVVDILRRKLWAEHLGYSLARNVPDPAAADLMNRPAGGWLKLWSDRAAATLRQLKDTPSLPLVGMARVLPWPSDNTTYKTPRDHLTALGIRSHAVVPLKSTRAFDFKTGDWKPGSTAKMDY